mgnify:CR=1 FL=1
MAVEGPSRMKAIQQLLNRSLWLYVAVAVIFAVTVDFKKATKQRAHYLFGIFYNQDLRNYKDGIVYFDYLIHQRPDDSRNYFFLGYCYLFSNDYYRAARYFERALKLVPEDALIQQYLAYAKNKILNNGSEIPLPVENIQIPIE